jgi:hypothetical protein
LPYDFNELFVYYKITKHMKQVILFFVLVLFIIGCKVDEKETVVEETAAAVMDYALLDTDFKSENFEAQTEQKIIKEGNLRYETQDLQATYQQIISATKKHKAYIQSDEEGKDYNSLYRNLIVRLPSKNFDVYLAEISTGVDYFDRKEISSKDVTAEYIDIEARLKAKKTLESRYLELLKKATKVSEILEIGKELSVIREEIESKEGQLKYLQNKVSLSTVTINFYKTVANSQDATVSFSSKIWNAIKSGWNGISTFFIGLLHIWPFIIILVAVILYIRKRIASKKP